MFPSIKALDRAFPGKGRELRKAFEAKRAELALHPAGAARIAECYHPPKTYDVRMHVLDAIAETHGVEYIQHKDDTFKQVKGFDYLNTGDTYALTIVRNCVSGSYRVASCGEITERSCYSYV